MPHRHYPPAYLRYLKARLWNLGKPSIWGTAIFLSVMGLVIREYWSNPNAFTVKRNQEVTSLQPKNSSLSAEDKAIAADIDNLPALYNDLNQVSLPATNSSSKENSQVNKSLLDVSKKQSSDAVKSNPSTGIVNYTPEFKEQNPFVSQAEDLLQFGTLNSSGQFSGVKSLNTFSQPTRVTQTSSGLGIGSVNQTDSSQNRNSISALQAPLNQSINQPLSSFNDVSSTQANFVGQTAYGVMQTPSLNSSANQTVSPTTMVNTGTGYIQPTVTNPTPNSYNNFNNGQVLPSQAQPTPVTQAVTSATPTVSSPYSNQNLNPNFATSTTPVVPNNYGNSWQQPNQLPQSNFSVNR